MNEAATRLSEAWRQSGEPDQLDRKDVESYLLSRGHCELVGGNHVRLTPLAIDIAAATAIRLMERNIAPGTDAAAQGIEEIGASIGMEPGELEMICWLRGVHAYHTGRRDYIRERIARR